MRFQPTAQHALDMWRAQPGQIWQVGRHRVLCGDATNSLHTKQLLAGQRWDCLTTSPPYLSRRNYLGARQSWMRLAVGFMEAAMPHSATNSDCLVNLGLVHEDRRVIRYWEPWLTALEARGWPLFGWYVWDKLHGFPGEHSGRLAPTHEWLFHFQQGVTVARQWIPTKPQSSMRRHTKREVNGTLRAFTGTPQPYKMPDSVIRAPRELHRGVHTQYHPATASQEVTACLLNTWSGVGQLVYDPFGGSGTTLLTCEALGRVCFTSDIAPEYVALILERWRQMTGTRPERVQ